MEFRKYQHVERFGTPEVKNIEIGTCYIFPKIDGSNSSVWLNNGILCAGSRNRELNLKQDNAGFFEHINKQDNVKQMLIDYPNYRLYGEWLTPHSLKTYKDSAWKKFYVFDVIEELEEDNFRYLPYEEYKILMDKYSIDYIPPIEVITNTNYEQLIRQLEKNVFLIQDGKGVGEGIVIKRYDYKNQYGRTTWAKIVTSEFKEKHAKIMCKTDKPMKGKQMVEEDIVNKYITTALCEKTYAKIIEEKGEWQSKYIPMLLNMVYYDLVREDCWNFVKDFKNPTINFGTLQYMVFNKVKEIMQKYI